VTLTLTNLLTTPVSPIFFVKWSPLPYVWNSDSNASLSNGSAHTYTLTAPDALSAVPRGDQFRVMVYDKLTGQLLGESPAAKADVAAPAVANPGLKWWELDERVGKQVPFGWKLTLSNTDLASSRITPVGVNGASGIHMILNNTVSGQVANLALSQRVFLSSSKVSLSFDQPQPVAAAHVLFAESVTDGTHTLFFVFSNRTTQQTIGSYATNTTVMVPMKASVWNTVTIDPSAVWNTQGWGTPQQVTMALFLESDSLGVFDASIMSVNPA
jgi:hypothetical protein